MGVSDRQLLETFVRSRSESAFAELVGRHVDWVYSAARRRVGDAHLAEDVTQAVFLVLAQKAAKLHAQPVLAAWLFRVLRYAAGKAVRSETRRRIHEQEAAMIAAASDSMNDEQWHDLAPLLEDLVAKLTENDRSAILLRFYQRKSMAEVGQEMGISEGAAKKRVGRAVDRLRGMATSQGLTLGAAALATGLWGNAAQAAPAGLAGLAGTIATTAAGTTTVATGGTAWAIAKGAINMMTWVKIKMTAVGLLVAAAVAGSAGLAIQKAVSSRTAPEAPATTRVAAPRFVAKLRDGTTCELVAIGEQSTGQWWFPDGTPTQPPYPSRDHVRDDVANPKPDRRYLYLVTLISRADGPIPAYTNATNDAFKTPAVVGTSFDERNYRTQVIEIAPSMDTIPYRLRIASQPSRDVVRLAAGRDGKWDPMAVSEETVAGAGIFRLASPREEKGRATFDAEWPASGGRIGSEYSVSVEAIDRRGKPVWNVSSMGNGGTDETRIVRIYQALADLAEVRLSVIRFDEWVEFRNVSLRPDARGEVQIVTGELSDAATQAVRAENLDPLYEKAPGSGPALSMKSGPNTFAVTAVVRYGVDGKPAITDGRGKPIDAGSLPLDKLRPPSSHDRDVVVVFLTPGGERYDIDRLRIFEHAKRRYVRDLMVTQVPELSALQIVAPPGLLPDSIDLWLDVASYDEANRAVRLAPKKDATVQIGAATVGIEDIRDGSWSFEGKRFTTAYKESLGRETTCMLRATGQWDAGRYQISAVSKAGPKYQSDFVLDLFRERSPIHRLEMGLEEIDYLELRPLASQPPFYFDGVMLPAVARPAQPRSPFPAPVIVKAGKGSRAEVPCGAVVELTGISYHPSKDKPWWNAHGEPVGRPTTEGGAFVSNDNGRQRTREFVARLVESTPEAHGLLWDFPNASGWANSSEEERAHATVSLPADGPVSVRIGVPASPYRTIEEMPVEKLPRELACWPGRMGPLESDDRGVVLRTSAANLPSGARLVLVDQTGSIHEHAGSSSLGREKLPPWGLFEARLSFPGLSQQDVRAMRIEARQLEYAEFENVPMEPKESR